MSTPSIPGVNRNDLVEAIDRATDDDGWLSSGPAADVAIAHIAAHHECALPATWDDGGARPVEGEHGWVTPLLPDYTLPDGVRVRREWTRGRGGERAFVHRDDLPDDPRTLIARELGPARADTFLGLLDEHGWTVTRKDER